METMKERKMVTVYLTKEGTRRYFLENCRRTCPISQDHFSILRERRDLWYWSLDRKGWRLNDNALTYLRGLGYAVKIA